MKNLRSLHPRIPLSPPFPKGDSNIFPSLAKRGQGRFVVSGWKLRSLLSITIIILVVISSHKAVAGIKFTRHNLSTGGKYIVKAVSQTEICIFCHTPHNSESSQAPLWGHVETTQTFVTYSAPHTGGAAQGNAQPTGISKKCLSCHDGSLSVGATLNRGTIAMVSSTHLDASGKLIAAASPQGYLGTNLRTTHPNHPISFIYNIAATAKNALLPGCDPTSPSAPTPCTMKVPLSNYNINKILDRNGKVQCHSCHDPHNDWGTTTPCADTTYTCRAAVRDPLWRKQMDCSGDNASVCGACHMDIRRTDPNSFAFPPALCPDSNYDSGP